MNLVFAGTPQFAVPTLLALHNAGHGIPLVVTQPDRPRGRGMQLTAPPVKALAEQLGLSITQPDKIKNNPEFRARLEQIAPDAIIVVGYGRIIPPWMLDLPRLGNLNLHASLLPEYRGAAPIQWAIANGETLTGNTTMRLDSGLDTGDILLQQKEPILADDTAVTLAPRLAARGGQLMLETLRGLESGTIAPRAQDHSRATLAPILKREDGAIDFSRTATEILNRLRGFQPWPGAWTRFRGKSLNLWQARPVPPGDAAHSQEQGMSPPSPGRFLVLDDRLLLTCAAGTLLEILELQPEGKRRMPARDFIHGYRPGSAELLGA